MYLLGVRKDLIFIFEILMNSDGDTIRDIDLSYNNSKLLTLNFPYCNV